jgi:hypothetical protein
MPFLFTRINENPEGAGFSVRMEALKNGKAVERIRFTVRKVDTRMAMERQLKPRPAPPQPPPLETGAGFGITLGTRTYEKAKKAAPDFDIYGLEAEWRDWIKGKPLPNDPDAAFVGFCRKRQRKVEAG